MNIVLLSSPSKGGAGLVSYQLKDQLELIGHKVYIISRFSEKSEKNVYVIRSKNLIISKINKKINSFFFKPLKKYHFFDKSVFKSNNLVKLTLSKINFKVDLIIVSFYQNFFNWKNIYDLQKSTNAPIIFWMMDMASFTGGCHYSYNCNRYEKECGFCPAINSKRKNDISNQNIKYKLKLRNSMDYSAIAISNFQKVQAQQSSTFKNKEIRLMYHSIDFNTFYPIDISNYSKTSNESDLTEFLFCASNISEERKGFHHLIEALKLIENEITLTKNIKINIIGKNDIDESINLRKIKLNFLGTVSSKENIRENYQRALYTIIPTLADSGPLTIMESLACGTPVIAYNMGIGQDLKDKNIGFISNKNNPTELFNLIKKALELSESDYLKQRHNAYNVSIQMFTPEIQRLKLINILNN